MVVRWEKRTANKYSGSRPSTPGWLKSYAYIHVIEPLAPLPDPVPEPERKKKKRKRRRWYSRGDYSKDWPEFSLKMRQESGFRCGLCSAYRPGKKQLVVHHLDENKRNNDLTNLMVLCTHCHFKAHRHG